MVDDYAEMGGDRHLRKSVSSPSSTRHVRGFTQHKSSDVKNPGTYLGIIEKIPYLKSLGVTAELMPVHEFPVGGFHGQPVERQNCGVTIRWHARTSGTASVASPARW